MQRYRRLLVIDRLIPFLAALVALVAIAGMVAVELNSRAARAELAREVADLKAALGQGAPAGSAAATVPPEVTAQLSALTERLTGLEADLKTLETASASAPAATPGLATLPAPVAPEAQSAAVIDPSLPTKDCIPLGTRFIVTPGESYPMCQSTAVVKVGVITSDTVDVQGAGSIVRTGFATLAGTKCTVMVFSADAAGFGELRVTCS